MKHFNILNTLAFGLLLSALTACEEKAPIVGTASISDKTEVSVAQGKTLQLQTNTPADFAGDSLVWISVDDAIATVDKGGIVTGIAPGSTQVLATKGERTLACYTVWVYNSKRYFKVNGVCHPVIEVSRNTENSSYYELCFADQEIPDGQPYYFYNYGKPALYFYVKQSLPDEVDIDFANYGGNDNDVYVYLYQEKGYGYADIYDQNGGGCSFKLTDNGYQYEFTIDTKMTVFNETTSETVVMELHYNGTPEYESDWW